MTRKEFIGSEVLRGSLFTLLEADVMKLAFSVLQSEPPKMPTPIPGVSYGEQVAAEGARRVGYLEALADLKRLTRSAKAIEADPNKEVLFADAATQSLTDRGIYSAEELKQFSTK